jgi:RNA polymerase sigma-70 factor (TIGR02954 family)
MTTDELVLLAKQGDDDAFFLLISAEKARFYNIAFAYLRNESEALEALQEVTCRAYEKLGKLKDPQYFYTWVIRILIHYCIDEQKRNRKMIPLLHLPNTLTTESTPMEEKIRLEWAIAKLSPRYRHIIILKYYQDMTLIEISKLLEKPEGTVKTWLNKALIQLRVYIGKDRSGDYA